MKNFLLPLLTICILSPQLQSQILYEQVAYSVAHNNGNANVLYQFNATTNQWKEIGLTGTTSIKAIATDIVNKTIYAVDGGTFGTINPQTGMFSPIGEVGQANGDKGVVDLNNIEGLTFDPINQIIYATHRVYSGEICAPVSQSNDLLFQIDISTGQFKPNAMLDADAEPIDYAVVQEVPFPSISDACSIFNTMYDVNDIAYNTYTGELYSIQNQKFAGVISVINAVDGTAEAIVVDLDTKDMIGLATSSFGEMYGTAGGDAVNEPIHCFKYINLYFPEADNLSFIEPNATNVDFRSLGFLGPYNDLALKLVVDPGTTYPINPGDAVTFNINIYNQGELDINEIRIFNYIPEGLVLNDPDWNGIAGYMATCTEYTGSFVPGSSITVPITFTVDPDFTGNEIINSAEISVSFNYSIITDDIPYGDPIPLPDIDSWPDEVNNEVDDNHPLIDNIINQSGPLANEDEDDHDIAKISIGEFTENLLFLTTATPATCNGSGAIEIEIFDNSTPPYTFKLLGPYSSLVHLETNSNPVHQITDLPPATYYAIVSDAAGKTSSLIVKIDALAQNNGNSNCNVNCPETLVTPDDLLNGIFQAEELVEVNGFVEGSQNATFLICK